MAKRQDASQMDDLNAAICALPNLSGEDWERCYLHVLSFGEPSMINSGSRLVPKREHDYLIEAARDICEMGPDPRLVERLRDAGKQYYLALRVGLSSNATHK